MVGKSRCSGTKGTTRKHEEDAEVESDRRVMKVRKGLWVDSLSRIEDSRFTFRLASS